MLTYAIPRFPEIASTSRPARMLGALAKLFLSCCYCPFLSRCWTLSRNGTLTAHMEERQSHEQRDGQRDGQMKRQKEKQRGLQREKRRNMQRAKQRDMQREKRRDMQWATLWNWPSSLFPKISYILV
jgi:hypothetical protein